MSQWSGVRHPRRRRTHRPSAPTCRYRCPAARRAAVAGWPRSGAAAHPLRRSTPGVKAATAATCARAGGQMVKFPVRQSTARWSSCGTSSQPRRQPVIAKYFEKLFTTTASRDVCQAQLAGGGAFVDQAVVHLVADQPDAGFRAPSRDGGEFLGRDHRAGRVGGAGDDHALHRRIEFGEHLRGRLEPRVWAAGDLDHFTAERREDVSVAGVSRTRDGDPVTDVETGEERQQEAAARAGRDDDVGGVDGKPVPVGIRRGDRENATRGCPVRRCNRERCCPRRLWPLHGRQRVPRHSAGRPTGSPDRRGFAGAPRRPATRPSRRTAVCLREARPCSPD